MEVASRSFHDEKALFDEDDAEDDEIVLGRDSELVKEAETSKQRLLSAAKVEAVFEGLRTTATGHKIQDLTFHAAERALVGSWKAEGM